MPSSPYRPGYVDWEVAWWLTSEIRMTQPKALQMTYCEICWKLWIDGGHTIHNVEYLARLTLDTVENVTAILKWRHFQIHRDGTFSHLVVTEKLAQQQARREKGSRGGRPVKQDKPDMPDNVDNSPQNGITSGLTPGETTDRTNERLIERSSVAPRTAIVDNSPRLVQQHPGQIKPGFASETQKSKPPVKSRTTLTPERIAQLLDGCAPRDHADKHPARPWLSRMMGDWIDRQTSEDALAFRDAYLKRFGHSMDLGPEAQKVGGAENGGR